MLDETSKCVDDMSEINITLKQHQLAIIYKCLEIEKENICNFGIMSDKPGTGKTYAILGLIYHSKEKRNIIIIPQNILSQWISSIHNFSNGLLTYKKITDYSDVLELYNDNSTLFDYDILITTSLFYNVIATTMKSRFIGVKRVFFDEIDSISSLLINRINSDFIWFVSASFDKDELGVYTNSMPVDDTTITCCCNNDFIDKMFLLDSPNVYKIICKNIYLDNIFSGIFSKEEYKLLNGLDYSKLKTKFCKNIAQNEKEAVDYIVKDKIDIIEMEALRIDGLKKSIESTYNRRTLDVLNAQLQKSEKSLETNTIKLNLLRERLKENNCCPTCYEEFKENDNKAITPCCQNTICLTCTDNWYTNLKKKSCIYCNLEDITFDKYIIIKSNCQNQCLTCDKELLSDDDKFFATCCNKKCCASCLSDWYMKLLKRKCIFCNENTLLDDFKTQPQYDAIKLNEKAGVKYIKKTKLEFLDYFVSHMIYKSSKVIFCSNYIRIFNDIKKIFNKYHIAYRELDSVNADLQRYKLADVNALLLNSNLFGCGLNLEYTTDIVFLHKTDSVLEKQIIGRAQRPGRVRKLNIWHISHENESVIEKPPKKEVVYESDSYPDYFPDLDICLDEVSEYSLI